MVDFQSQVIQSMQEGETARGDLRQLLRLSPATTLELTTEMDYRRVDPDIGKLRTVALDVRPDIKARRFTYSQRESDLKLAKAYRIPDVTIGAGYAVQGPQGPDNPQQWALEPGGALAIVQSESGRDHAGRGGVQTAEADLNRTVNQVENEVDVAYQESAPEPAVGGSLSGRRAGRCPLDFYDRRTGL